MKKIAKFIALAVFVVLAASLVNADLIPITAEQAFDAQASQVDPESGEPANVVIVDIRSVAEYHWVGAPARVDNITTKRSLIVPDDGKVNIFGRGNNLLRFKVNGNLRVLSAKSVENMKTSPIAINIPYKTWDKSLNPDFKSDIEDLADENTSIILMCRSGKRTSEVYNVTKFNYNSFDAVYEIDQPDGKNGRGGFSGTSYKDAYNGYRGFPERKTSFKSHESVSWSDAGLPIHIGWGI
ncbi:MAG: hypothetical protein U9R34_05520 [Nanoarchaeota archaeon]|nr:hypothetical protein [Nanoarchaeota archaeon]